MSKKILHAFADTGAESYHMQDYGNVYRSGHAIDTKYGYGKAVQSDSTRLPFPDNTFYFGLFHPPCGKFSTLSFNPETFPNLIPEARSEAKRVCKYYAIENVQQAPLDNPLILIGDMFGKPFKYERHFETNYKIEQPPVNRTNSYELSWNDSTVTWKIEKEYPREFVGKFIRNNALPKCYIEHILEPLF